MTPDERIASWKPRMRARLRAEIAALLAQIEELAAQLEALQARLAKDSHNSNKPPSSDPLGRKRPRSQRRKSGKKPGGQLGHRGETLHLVATPDEVVEHRPAVCAECQTPLDETASVVLLRATASARPARRCAWWCGSIGRCTCAARAVSR